MGPEEQIFGTVFRDETALAEASGLHGKSRGAELPPPLNVGTGCVTVYTEARTLRDVMLVARWLRAC